MNLAPILTAHVLGYNMDIMEEYNNYVKEQTRDRNLKTIDRILKGEVTFIIDKVYNYEVKQVDKNIWLFNNITVHKEELRSRLEELLLK